MSEEWAATPPEQRIADPVRADPLLSAVLTALTGTDRLGEALQRCAQAVVDRMDGAFARIWAVNESAQVLELQASAGMYTHLDGPHGRIPLGAFKIGRIATERVPHLTNDVATDEGISDPEWAKAEGMVSFAGYPLLVGDRVVGVLALFARHPLEPQTLDVLSSVASSIALGLTRWRTEARLRDENRILENLYRLGTAIVEDLDVERVVQTVTDAATELSGAEFGAFLSDLTGEGNDSAVEYSVAAGTSSGTTIDFPLPRIPALLEPTFRGNRVIRLDDVLADQRYGLGPTGDLLADHLPIRSYLAVPVVARTGTVLGGLFFGHRATAAFSEHDERIVRGIAGYAAVAIENARMYEREHEAALALQRSLLPDRLPGADGVALAGRYVPASRHADVGGDWYDGVLLADGRLVLSVGDVVGHDLRAAAIMGQVRTAARAYAIDTCEPAAIIARLDRFMREAEFPEFATTLQLLYDPKTRVVEAMSAGHVPPLVILPGAEPHFLELFPLPPVGLWLIDPTAPTLPSRTLLPPGSAMVLFTDGLIERRDESLEAGMERLRTAAAAGAGLKATDLCDHLVDQLAAGRRDDVAVVVLQTC